MTKYEIGDDHEWYDEKKARKEREEREKRTTLDTHKVDVVHQYGDDPMWDRRKYTVHIKHRDADSPIGLYAIPHRWKGNFWREYEFENWVDWCDLPYPVRERVADVVACDGVDDLDPGCRVVQPEDDE